MNKIIVAVGIAGLAMLADPSAASAHENGRHAFDHPGSYRVPIARSRAMPFSLRRDPYFLDWYRYTPLRHVRRLTWSQLYEAHRRETRYAKLRWSHGYRDYVRPERDWYRRYWKRRYRKHRHHDYR